LISQLPPFLHQVIENSELLLQKLVFIILGLNIYELLSLFVIKSPFITYNRVAEFDGICIDDAFFVHYYEQADSQSIFALLKTAYTAVNIGREERFNQGVSDVETFTNMFCFLIKLRVARNQCRNITNVDSNIPERRCPCGDIFNRYGIIYGLCVLMVNGEDKKIIDNCAYFSFLL
jgi:hypothetical protein